MRLTPGSSGQASTVACSGAGGVCTPASGRMQVDTTPDATEGDDRRSPGTITLGRVPPSDSSSTESHELYEQRGLERFEERERYGEFHAELERYGHLYGGLQRRRGCQRAG